MRRWGAEKADLAEGVISVEGEWTGHQKPVPGPSPSRAIEVILARSLSEDWSRGRLRWLVTPILGAQKQERVAVWLLQQKSRAPTWPVLTSPFDQVTSFSPKTGSGSPPGPGHFQAWWHLCEVPKPPPVLCATLLLLGLHRSARVFAAQCGLFSPESNSQGKFLLLQDCLGSFPPASWKDLTESTYGHLAFITSFISAWTSDT